MSDRIESRTIALATQERETPPNEAAPTEGERVLLPRRPGESCFAPLQYYYSASRTGVVPEHHSSVWQPELAVAVPGTPATADGDHTGL
jgi:hypothetical protein